jgi:hypothetical protein
VDSESKEQTQLLRNIWNQAKDMNVDLGGRIDALGGRVDALGDRVDALGDRVDALGVKIDDVNTSLSGRLDNLIEVSSRWYWDLERRVRALEEPTG